MQIRDQKYTLKEMLLMRMTDELAYLSWSKTSDAQKGINRPESILRKALQMDVGADQHIAFDSADDFKSAWKRITGG